MRDGNNYCLPGPYLPGISGACAPVTVPPWRKRCADIMVSGRSAARMRSRPSSAYSIRAIDSLGLPASWHMRAMLARDGGVSRYISPRSARESARSRLCSATASPSPPAGGTRDRASFRRGFPADRYPARTVRPSHPRRRALRGSARGDPGRCPRGNRRPGDQPAAGTRSRRAAARAARADLGLPFPAPFAVCRMGDETHRALTADTITRTGLIRSPIRPNMNGDRTTHLRLLNTLLATRTRRADRLSGAVPVYTASEQGICGVDM